MNLIKIFIIGLLYLTLPSTTVMGEENSIESSSQSLKISQNLGNAEKYEQFTLRPEESYSIQGITVHWQIPHPLPINSLGVLVCQGKNTSIQIPLLITPETLSNIPCGFVYLEEQSIEFEFNTKNVAEAGQRLREDLFLSLILRHYPNQYTFDAMPVNDLTCMVSNACPLTLNQWQLKVSEQPEKDIFGNEYLQFIILNKETRQTESIRLNAVVPGKAGLRKIGRFNLKLFQMLFTQDTKTVKLNVNVDPDYSIQGKDAFVDYFDPEHISIGEFLKRMGEKYHFTVQWEKFPSHPDLDAKVLELPVVGDNTPNRNRRGILKNILNDWLEDFTLTWKDPQHVLVRYKKYEQMLHQIQEKERIRRERQAEADRLQKEKAAIFEKLKKEYELRTQIYVLKNIQVQTAKSLAEKELRVHQVLHINPNQKVSGVTETFIIRSSAIPQSIEKSTSLDDNLKVLEAQKEGIIILLDQKGQELVNCKKLVDSGRTTSNELLKAQTDYELVRVQLKEIDAKIAVKQEEMSLNKLHNNDLPAPFNILEEISEIVIADDRTNALIVTAVPATQKRIAEIIQKMDALITEEKKSGIPATCRIEIILLNGLKEPDPSKPAVPDISQYGLNREDLKQYGIQYILEIGKGISILFAEAGKVGRTQIALTQFYSGRLEFMDIRDPYLVVKGSLIGKDSEMALLENTLFLEKGKPTVMGLTNLRDALILVMRWVD